MTGSLAKYHARSPRYILQPEDSTILRIAGPMQTPWDETTDIKNISVTGLAFTVASDLCPSMGEFVKIQYEIPSSRQMACHAVVTRLDEISAKRTLVGVKFYRMDLAQRLVLAQSLAARLREQQVQKMNQRRANMSPFKRYAPHLFFTLWAILFYVLSSWDWLQSFTANLN